MTARCHNSLLWSIIMRLDSKVSQLLVIKHQVKFGKKVPQLLVIKHRIKWIIRCHNFLLWNTIMRHDNNIPQLLAMKHPHKAWQQGVTTPCYETPSWSLSARCHNSWLWQQDDTTLVINTTMNLDNKVPQLLDNNVLQLPAFKHLHEIWLYSVRWYLTCF